MKMKTTVLFALPIIMLTSTILNSVVYAVEERKVLSRNYVGLGVEVYAPYQCYPSENVTVKVRVEALEEVENASVTLFIWSSKSEGHNPWGTSFTVLDVTDFPNGMIKEETCNITIPSDIDPGLAYGILFLDWSVYIQPSWEDQWDKASFRATYIKNKDYEDLQTTYNSVLKELQNLGTTTYALLATTIVLAASTAYLAKKKPKTKKVSSSQKKNKIVSQTNSQRTSLQCF